MSLNQIKLSPFLLTELYRRNLVEAPSATAKAQPISGFGAAYLGGNAKNILVVVENETEVIPDNELTFLRNLLGACNLAPDDVAIVNWKHWSAAGFADTVAKFESRIVFLFDVEPLRFGLPVSFPQFQVQAVSQRTFLFAPRLQEIENDKLLKSKLWLSLKRIFAI